MPAPVKTTLQKSGYGTWIEVRTDRLLSNLRKLKQFVGYGPDVMAVVKANAYGHGLIEISKALAGEVQYLGISSLYEALELKEHGIETPLFLFGRLFGSEITTAIKNRLTLSVSSLEEAAEIAKVSESLELKTALHVKIDTGMGRLGIPLAQALKTVPKIAALHGIYLEGLYTHFPTAESDDGFRDQQFQQFSFLLDSLKQKGITFRFRHAANSSANLKMRVPMLNLIRPGLILYGIYPDPCFKAIRGFAPILNLKSRIMLLKRLEPGQSVGYGRSFVAKKATTIATLPIGYSHGYPFHLSNKASVLYRGKRYPVAGRVSMDYLCVDLGQTEAHVGDEVTLIGEENGNSIRAEELAAWAGTIPYEIVTRLASRVPRLYLR